MKTRRLIALGILVPGLLGGCGSGGKVKSKDFEPTKPQVAQPAHAEPQAPARAPARVGDQMDANAGSANALAAKTQSYLQEMSPLIQARRAAQPQGSPPAAPSQVQWMEAPWPDASDLRLGGPTSIGPTPKQTGTVRQVIDATPATANPSTPATVIPQAPPANGAQQATLKVDPIAIADASERPKGPAANPAALDAASIRLEARIKDSPRDVWLHTEYQLTRLLRDEPTPDMATLSTLPQEDRELVTAVVDGMTNFRNAMRQDSNMLLSAKIRPILEMSDRLRSQAELTIPTIALCTKVERFGIYDPIEPARFPAEKEHPVIVYCEVANFLSNLNGAQMWQTQLQWDMTLYTEQAIPVWSDQTQLIEDGSRAKRRDFFVRKLITLPKSLPVGRYLLKVTIVDKQSNHVAEATAPLVIAAQ